MFLQHRPNGYQDAEFYIDFKNINVHGETITTNKFFENNKPFS
jgi:hypothetical protein